MIGIFFSKWSFLTEIGWWSADFSKKWSFWENFTKLDKKFSVFFPMYTKTKHCKASHILYKYHDIFSLFFPVWEKVVRKYCENSVIFSDISKEFVKSSIFLFFSNRLIWEKATFYKFLRKRKFYKKWKFMIFSRYFSQCWKNSVILHTPMTIFSQMDQLSADLRIKMRILGNLVSFFVEKMAFSNWENFPQMCLFLKSANANFMEICIFLEKELFSYCFLQCVQYACTRDRSLFKSPLQCP